MKYTAGKESTKMTANKSYQKMVNDAEALIKEMDEIEGFLYKGGFWKKSQDNSRNPAITINNADGQPPIPKKVIDPSTTAFPINKINDFIRSSNQLSAKVIEFNRDVGSEEAIEVSRQRAIRKAERSDMWILWFQKLARWAFGVFVAVILYSFLVFISKGDDSFIKVPIRDLVIQSSSVKSLSAPQP